MRIVKTKDDKYFNEHSLLLDNCYLVVEDGNTYHYEFLVTKNEAEIHCDSIQFIKQVTEEYHQEHPYISKYHTKDQSFYMAFDEIHTFKLPLSILQVSKAFLDQSRLEKLRNCDDSIDLILPVQIVDDEYVVLDKHHLLYLAYEYGDRMVTVFVSDQIPLSSDYLYLIKEQNIRTIKDMHIITHEEYEEISKQLYQLLGSI